MPLRYRAVQAIFPLILVALGLLLFADSSNVTVLDFGTNDGEGSWFVSAIVGPVFFLLGIVWLAALWWKAAVGVSARLFEDHIAFPSSIFYRSISYSELTGVIANTNAEDTPWLARAIFPSDQWALVVPRPRSIGHVMKTRHGDDFSLAGLGFMGDPDGQVTVEQLTEYLKAKIRQAAQANGRL